MTRRRLKFRGFGVALGAAVVLGALLLAAPALSAPSLLAWWGEAGEGDGQIGAAAPGIAVDSQGDVYVVDRAVSRVKRFTNAGAPAVAWGGMEQPSAVAIAPDGTVYVGDRDRLRRFTRDGKPVADWNDAARFDAPAPAPAPAPGDTATPHPRGVGGIAVAADGTVYATDLGSGRVRRFDAKGAELAAWTGVSEPRGVAVSPGGDVYVADDGNNRVRRFSPQGTELGAWELADPHGVAVAPDGQVYVADTSTNRVLRYAADGKLQEAFGDTGEGGTRLNQPMAAAVDCQGTVYVLDDSEKRVHTFGDPAAAPPPCTPAPITPATVTPTPTETAAPAPQPPPPPPAPPPTPEPQLGATTLAEVVEGKVLVDTGKGKLEPLSGPAIVPIGATVDTTNGRARLTFETAPDARQRYGPYQSGEFYGGEFTVHQASSGTLVELRLAGAVAARSHGARASSKKKRKHGARRLWGNAEGRFRTTGRYAAATVRGTRWLTEDRAGGTLVQVQEGVVDVRELERDRSVTLRAGQQHLARPRCASRRDFRIRLRAPVGATVRQARVLVNGRRVRVWRGSRPTARVDLRGLPKGRVTVRIAVRTATGLTLRGTRSYLTCSEARSGGVPRL